MLKKFSILLWVSVVYAAVPGIDVSRYQPDINWNNVKSSGKMFVYIKATEGFSHRSPYFSRQYTGATNVGLIRGGYHFALPNRSSGSIQANFFVDNGGGWSNDGRTLPGALDIEYNPYGTACYGFSQAAMVNWIRDFSDTYKGRTGRAPVIYTNADWWRTCTGNNPGFGAENPLWIARHETPSPGILPRGWSFHSIWQYNNHSDVGGDSNLWNGDCASLQRFARG